MTAGILTQWACYKKASSAYVSIVGWTLARRIHTWQRGERQSRHVIVSEKIGVYMNCIHTLCLKKGYHPTTNDNFNNSCPIPVIFGKKYCWVNMPSNDGLTYHLTCLLYVRYLRKVQHPKNHEFSLKLQISVMVSIAVSKMGMTEVIFIVIVLTVFASLLFHVTCCSRWSTTSIVGRVNAVTTCRWRRPLWALLTPRSSTAPVRYAVPLSFNFMCTHCRVMLLLFWCDLIYGIW